MTWTLTVRVSPRRLALLVVAVLLSTQIAFFPPATHAATFASISAVGQVLSLRATGAASVGVQVSGTFTGLTLVFEASQDGGTTWISVSGFPFAGGAAVSAVSGTGNWLIPVYSFTLIRVRATAIASGSAIVALEGGALPPVAYQYQIVTGDTTLTQAPQASGVSIAQAHLYAHDGTNWQQVKIASTFPAPLNAVACAAETTVWTPTAGKKFRLMGILMNASVAGNLLFRDGTAGTIIAVIPTAAGGSVTQAQLGNGILSSTINNVLTVTGPAAATCSGGVFGAME